VKFATNYSKSEKILQNHTKFPHNQNKNPPKSKRIDVILLTGATLGILSIG